MDAQRKSIQSLTASLDEKREELSMLYRQFGSKLLNDSADESHEAPALQAERIEAWRSFMTGREADTQSVLDIKAALARQSELNQFRKELERTRDEGTLSLEARLETLGKAFFALAPGDGPELLGEVWASADEAAASLAAVEERQRVAREELEAAGFFGKMKAQFRLAGLESDLRQGREKLSKLYREGGRALIGREAFGKRVSDGEFDADFARTFQSAMDAGLYLDDLSGRVTTLESDLELVKEGLTEAGALENPQRRMDELRNRIRDTDRRIDSHASLVAREYVDNFFDDEGATRLGNAGETADTAGMGAYARQLERAAALRREIAVIRAKIEALETAIKIETLERNIAPWQHTVRDYEQRIGKYRELIEAAGRDIREAGEERDRLVALREELERDAKSEGE